jgi:hypothetical protein
MSHNQNKTRKIFQRRWTGSESGTRHASQSELQAGNQNTKRLAGILNIKKRFSNKNSRASLLSYQWLFLNKFCYLEKIVYIHKFAANAAKDCKYSKPS